MDDVRPNVAPLSGRFTDQLRLSIRARGLSYATEKTYVHWILRYIRQQGMRHPTQMGAPEVEAFLTWWAQERRCSIATQRTALNALVILYKHNIGAELGELSAPCVRQSSSQDFEGGQAAIHFGIRLPHG